MDAPPLRIVEFYAGIGGFHCALKESGVRGEVAASIDINTNTARIYAHNFPDTNQLNRNICGLTAEELDQMKADVFFLSPPCQPFTRQGNKLDSRDRRTDSFFHLMHTLEKMHSPPRYLLMENVKGFETSRTRDEFVGILTSLRYDVREFLLSPSQFSVPNSRLRFYLLARRKPLQFPVVVEEEVRVSAKPSEDAERLIGCMNGSVCEERLRESVAGEGSQSQQRTGTLSDYLELIDDDNELGKFLVPDKILRKYATALDIVRKSSHHSCCFTRAYGNYAVGTGSIFQHSLDEKAFTEAFADFSKLRGEGESSGGQAEGSVVDVVECLHRLKLRYFTPKEVANLMCFPKEYGFPPELTVRQCYKALGNSLNVRVVGVLIRYLLLNPTDQEL